MADPPRVWPDMRDAVLIFFRMSTQWVWTSVGQFGAMRVGLKYEAIPAVAQMMGLEVTAQTFDDIGTLEREALAVWSKR